MLWMLRRERPQEEVLGRLGDHLRTTTMAGLRVAFLSAFVLELVAMLGTAVVAVTIGLRLVHGDLPLATGFALLLVTPEVYARLRDVGVRYHASREGSLAAGRVLDLLDASPATAVAGQRPAPDPAHVDVVVHGVTVVAAGREPALVDADLVVPAGRLVVLAGPSGAGKTTLARLVAGLAGARPRPRHGRRRGPRRRRSAVVAPTGRVGPRVAGRPRRHPARRRHVGRAGTRRRGGPRCPGRGGPLRLGAGPAPGAGHGRGPGRP